MSLSNSQELTLKRVILNTVLDLHSWLAGMKSYADSQYGKKQIKTIHDSLLSKILMQPADNCYVSVMEVIWEPKQEWTWDHNKLQFRQAIVEGTEDLEQAFKVYGSGMSSVVFPKPVRGILLMSVIKDKNDASSNNSAS